MARVTYALLAIALALFFAFVGGNKVLASIPDLAAHHAWTVWLPEWLGRAVGVSELLCALGLLAGIRTDWRPWGRIAAGVLVINQIVAGAVHILHGEASALPQNGVLIAMALMACVLASNNCKRESVNG